MTAFSVKDDMALAKAPRLPLEDKSGFDQLLEHQSYSSDYIQACKSKSKIFSTRCKKKPGSNDDDVTIVSSDDSPKHQWMRFKLLQFCENHRPAYYGTWRKSRGSVNPRNPFKKDEVSKLASLLRFHCCLIARGCLIMRLTVTMSGKKKNQERVSQTVRSVKNELSEKKFLWLNCFTCLRARKKMGKVTVMSLRMKTMVSSSLTATSPTMKESTVTWTRMRIEKLLSTSTVM